MGTYKFLEDESELKFFWHYVLPPLKQNEVYFLAAACRNKHLTEDERKFFAVGRSEMYAKQIIRDDSYYSFKRHILRFETVKDAYHTKNGLPYPDKGLVLYSYICPMNAYTAMHELTAHISDVQMQLTNSALKQSKDALTEAWYKVRKVFDSSQSIFAKNMGTRIWIDIDADISEWQTVKGWEALENIKAFLNERIGLGNYVIAWTAGGLHFLIRRNVLKFDPGIIAEFTRINFTNAHVKVNEVVLNKNNQIPLPGTVQYKDHVVRILNKDDFKSEHRLHENLYSTPLC